MTIFTPGTVALLSLVLGAGLAVAGIYLLAGLGWSLIGGAVPMLLLSLVILRGLHRAKENP